VRPTKTQFAPRAMNSQVGPSIILSVFIVCFFAVALFRHEPRHSAARGGGKQALRGNPGQAPRSASRPTDIGARLAAPSIRRPLRPAPETASEKARGGTNAFTSAEVSSPIVRPASARSETAIERLLSSEGDVVEKANREPAAQRPRSAFTVVERDETIRDVAVRIYGSLDAVDSLWRANRDLLPTRESALSPGTFLRTPIVR
jgi:hypothetical protein